jgi:hypothetical protein
MIMRFLGRPVRRIGSEFGEDVLEPVRGEQPLDPLGVSGEAGGRRIERR